MTVRYGTRVKKPILPPAVIYEKTLLQRNNEGDRAKASALLDESLVAGHR